MGQARIPSGAPRKASQRRTAWRTPPVPTTWVTPTWQPGAQVAWDGRIGLFLREAEDDQVELLIGSRTYRVRRAEVRSVEAARQQRVAVAQQAITERCSELGIPARFAPNVEFSWRGRGENAIKDRRTELRAVAKSRIEAIEKSACTKIEMLCLDAQSQILAHGLTSAAAIAFFDALPKVEVLMPPLEMASVEQMLLARKASSPRYGLSYGG